MRAAGAAHDPIRLGLFAGIHGDEPAGCEALAHLLADLADNPEIAKGYDLVIYPVCNPTGYEGNTRFNRAGFDLNRDGYFDLDVQKRMDAGGTRVEPDFHYRAGATIIIDPATREVIEACRSDKDWHSSPRGPIERRCERFGGREVNDYIALAGINRKGRVLRHCLGVRRDQSGAGEAVHVEEHQRDVGFARQHFLGLGAAVGVHEGQGAAVEAEAAQGQLGDVVDVRFVIDQQNFPRC